MTVYVTEKQYKLVSNALSVMIRLYDNDMLALFLLICNDYKLNNSSAHKASELIRNMQITDKNEVMKAQCAALLFDWGQKEKLPDNGKYQYAIELAREQQKKLANILDTFSRITMGQLHILFEALDIPNALKNNQHAVQMYHDIYWDGLYGAKEARDILFPGIKEFGWHGGYGITSKEVSENSKLAYQMSRVLRNERPLQVTGEPLPMLL